MAHYQRILLTGASGRLGSRLRKGLAPLADKMRLAAPTSFDDLGPNEEQAVFDLADAEATIEAARGCDAIVHFGGVGTEEPWQTILDANIRGSYHIYEAARKHGVRRVIYASSVHAVGFHEMEAQIGVDAPHRPDSLYGVSKCFVESLSRLYWDKFGIETACLRIFSSFDEPTDRRMLWSFLTYADCVRLVEAALTAPRVGHSFIYGTSDNRLRPYDNSGAGHIGFAPQDNTEPYREAIEARTPVPDPHAVGVKYIGGWFCELGHPDDKDRSE